jgi:hypothetical protein
LEIPPPSERLKLIADTHQRLGHSGANSIFLDLHKKYFWSGLYSDVQTYLSKCINCVSVNSQHKYLLTPHSRDDGFFNTLHIDYAGPYPDSSSVLVVYDSFLHFTFLFQTPSTADKFTISSLQELFSIFGPPGTIVSDNNFGEEFHDFLRLGNINIRHSSAYHPTGNALAENAVKMAKEKLLKLKDAIPNLTKRIAVAQLALNQSPRAGTHGISPLDYLLGRNLTEIKDLNIPLQQDSTLDFVHLRQAAFQHLTARQLDLHMKSVDRLNEPAIAKPGQLAMIDAYPKSKTPKDAFKWTGPFVISSCTDSTVTLRDVDGSVFRRARDQVKLLPISLNLDSNLNADDEDAHENTDNLRDETFELNSLFDDDDDHSPLRHRTKQKQKRK